MSALKSLYILITAIVAFLAGIALLNFSVDPQCYYRCHELDLNKRTLNTYYQVAQRILAYPQAEVVILGSSRGENTPPLWVESVSGLKTLNLSASGAELATKLAFLKIAEQKTQLKKVIWFADYFELISQTADAKIKNTPALRSYLKGVSLDNGLEQKLREVQGLIDHNTLEASLHFLGNKDKTQITQGAGSDIDFASCLNPDFKGKETVESLKREVDMLYQSYTTAVIVAQQNTEALGDFKRELTDLARKGVEIHVVLTPYHPEFLARLKQQRPEIYERHQHWLTEVKSLQGNGLVVHDFFEGLTGDDGSPAYWNDGVHFTCKASIMMMDGLVQGWK
ncbi:hypothetical protein ACES2L_07070 [Bdellovibrio bacteriovorus]